MPTTYTHYAFGKEVFSLLPGKLQRKMRPCLAYYNIGVHGPDILFYYRAFSKNAVNQYGVKVHHEPMSVFLNHAFRVFRKEDEPWEAFSWLAGMMTHFILDSGCHPYIRRRIRETGISHTEIETDWDGEMMQRDGLVPWLCRPAVHISPRRKYARVIAPYFKQDAKTVQKSLFYMRVILNELFYSPWGGKRRLVEEVNRWHPLYADIAHHYMKRRLNPDNRETCRELNRIYRSRKKRCARLIVQMYLALQAGDARFCEKPVFAKTFA